MAAKFLGQFLLEQGLLDKGQLLAALDLQRASNPLLGELAQAQGLLDARNAQQINALQRSQDRPFGEIAVALGLLTEPQVQALLAAQAARRKLFGEILVEQGMLTREQLDQALAAQAAERDSAVRALELGVAGHPLEQAIATAMATCRRLFMRTLKRRCQFSSLVDIGADLSWCTVTGHVRIAAAAPLVIALGCSPDTGADIASAFLSLPTDAVDDALAQDALGELINVLMGYVAKDVVPEDARYTATPPRFDIPLDTLMAARTQVAAVAMESEAGPFVLMVGR